MDTEQVTVQTWDKQGNLIETRVDTVQLSPEETQRRVAIAGYKTAAQGVINATTNAQLLTATKAYVRATTKVLRVLDSRIEDQP